MNLDTLDRSDRRLIWACIAISAICLFVGVRYYFLAFPEASIEFRVTKDGSGEMAKSFLSTMGLDPSDYRHAAIFDFDDQQKTFLERELGVADSNRVLETTVRLWRWKHRWFRPLEKEEMTVEVTTKGEIAGFRHELPEDAPGDALPVEEARRAAETFLEKTMGRPLDELAFVESSTQKRPHRADHSFTWKLAGTDIASADYRLEVAVAGSTVAGYKEFLEVPDAWVRGYAELRSKNQVAGQVDSVLLILTIVAMAAFLVLRIRRGDVRWRAAAILGGLICLLLSVSQLNELPADLYGYDTTTSFPGFLLGRILGSLGTGFGGGLVVFVLTASAEPFYRERWPKLLSLTSLLRFRALRTKEFFIASLVGITLTFFFFAFENVFYLIANALGAWSPREVPYSDLLSTAFPWVYVLFFGFLPAISEEFISRMFSIPFFERIFRSTWAAVLVSSFIWGFGHAGYPNQPFWIRGLEVGLAGIVFALVMLRFGIAAVVICHFSVDALYTAFVLIRSPNPYYVITGSLSAGIFLVLLLIAAFLYLRAGGFLTAEVTNAVEGVAPPPEPRPAEADATLVASAGYAPMSGRRVAWGLALAVGLAALRLAPVSEFGDWVDFGTTRSAARDAGRRFLAKQGFEVSAYRTAIEIVDRTDPTAGAYLRNTGGLETAERFYRDLVPTPLWRVRYFVPRQKEEYWVSVHPKDGSVLGFGRTLAEDAPGATIETDRAREIAAAFLAEKGVDPAAGEIKEQSAKDEKARRDHTLVWELPEPGAGEARVRQEVVVQGDAVGSWSRTIKIPEDWRRQREKRTLLTEILRWLKFPFLAFFAVFAILATIRKIRDGAIPWKLAFSGGAVAGLATLVRIAVTTDTFWARYDTSVPASAHFVVIAIGMFLGAVLFAILGMIVTGLAGALWPDAATMFRREARALYARDALVAGIVSAGLVLGASALRRIVGAMFPSGTLVTDAAWPAGIEAAVPFLAALANSISGMLFAATLFGIVAGLLFRHFRSLGVRAALLAMFVVSFLPGMARTLPEYAVAALGLAIVAGSVIVLASCFLRRNPLAWLSAAFFGPSIVGAMRLVTQDGGGYRLDGILVLAIVAAWAVFLALSAFRRAPTAAA